jgi:hypothetical protein
MENNKKDNQPTNSGSQSWFSFFDNACWVAVGDGDDSVCSYVPGDQEPPQVQNIPKPFMHENSHPNKVIKTTIYKPDLKDEKEEDARVQSNNLCKEEEEFDLEQQQKIEPFKAEQTATECPVELEHANAKKRWGTFAVAKNISASVVGEETLVKQDSDPNVVDQALVADESFPTNSTNNSFAMNSSRDNSLGKEVQYRGPRSEEQIDDTPKKGEFKTFLLNRLKRKSVIVTLFVSMTLLWIFVFLIARYTGGSKGESAASSGSGSSFESSLPANHPCNQEGATRKDGVVLIPGEVLTAGEYRCSPSQKYMVVLTSASTDGNPPAESEGDLVLYQVDSNEVIWSAGVRGGVRWVMQTNGNVAIQNESGSILWIADPDKAGFFQDDGDTGSSSVRTILTDYGEIAIQRIYDQESGQDPNDSDIIYWIHGAPTVEEPSWSDTSTENGLKFPVRGAFYFASYDPTNPRSWEGTRHQPALGWYASSDPAVARAHVDAMAYGKIDLAIASWYGPGTDMDQPILTMLMDETLAQDAALKWTIYYEQERREKPSPTQIKAHLKYLKESFAKHEAWAYMDGKPILFVNSGSGCDAAERWMEAAENEWYIVVRLFDDFEACQVQPNSWHGQRVNEANNGVDIYEGWYHNLAPGEWRAGRDTPDLPRLNGSQWCSNVQDMVSSNEPWQLIVSFNEARAGTSIEPSRDWESDSGYGTYLDCLHNENTFERN